jgi:hypothetical protein
MISPPRAAISFAIFIYAGTCFGGKPTDTNGASIERAIPLQHKTAEEAVEEEMTWMKKLYDYTPLDATRDAYAEAVRQIKVEKKKEAQVPAPWEHASREYNGRLISYWWMRTPHGREEIYFDTGLPINTPGEVARRESASAHYMGERVQSLKIQ